MTAGRSHYLGLPGAMRRLPSPRGDTFDAAPTRGETVHALAGGGSIVAYQRATKHAWSLPYPLLEACDADTLLAFYDGMYGGGPFCLIDPSSPNLLDRDVSTMGTTPGSDPGWSATTGTLTSGGAPPEDAQLSAVLTWTGQASGDTLQPGDTGTADPDTATPYVSYEPCRVLLAACAAATTTVTLALAGYDTGGAYLNADLAVTVALDTEWRWITMVAAPHEPDLADAAFIQPLITATSDVGLSIAAALLHYDDGTTGAGWRRGDGAPRVWITSSPGRAVRPVDLTDHTLTLTER